MIISSFVSTKFIYCKFVGILLQVMHIVWTSFQRHLSPCDLPYTLQTQPHCTLDGDSEKYRIHSIKLIIIIISYQCIIDHITASKWLDKFCMNIRFLYHFSNRFFNPPYKNTEKFYELIINDV